MILMPAIFLSSGRRSSRSGTFLGPAVRAPELTIKSAVTIWSTHASSEPRTLLTNAAIVKIAAKLITMVATVIPERTGLRRRLSEANRASTHESPGNLADDCQNQPTVALMIVGAKKAKLSRKISMPITPTLNLETESPTHGATTRRTGATITQSKPSRLPQETLRRT